ncbi:MAG: 2-succinyl-5-enolpyruvyl-6-hydroxy-3-cyclohexene-1-carboxylic-acid synthase [Pseudonocardiales bacterium]|nr:MAG: 2-succinyl-5-enolpyruvyl-6-hydroxy-3-cyclohexene-1-carboxylic-acid synthase [Pseudonocardiales bacterium]
MAQVLLDELCRGGVAEAVLSPGSRSAPLALALAAEPRIRLHVRIDERSAGFLAVGLAQVSGRPVAVVCTSGTAAANLHPAVLEAAHAHLPLVILTADRPPELRGTGANQATDQIGLYGSAPVFFAEVGVPEERPAMVAYWRSLAARALAAATAGPVHLNVALREPLVGGVGGRSVGGTDGPWLEPLDGRADGMPWTAVRLPGPAPAVLAGPPGRGVVVVGHGAGTAAADAALRLAGDCGWPVLSEPTGNARRGVNAVATYPLLLADLRFVAAYRPDIVVTVGKPGLSRSLLAYLRTAARHLVVDPACDWADPTRSAAEVWPVVPVVGEARGSTAWLAGWLAADAAARRALDAALDAEAVSEPRLARDLVAALPDGALLVAGSSRPIRDLEAYPAARDGVRVVGNRGLSGIDGLVSTAVGAALAHDGPAYALLGDLTLLHDQNGLILGPDEPRPELAIVVVNNDGGGIFSTLEQASVQASEKGAFERVFGTPHRVDFEQLAAATATPYLLLTDLAKLPAALEDGRGQGLRIVEVRTDRTATAALHRRLQAAVAAALA